MAHSNAPTAIQPIKVREGEIKPIAVRQPTPAELALKQALRKAVALGNHSYSIAQLVGIYPA